MNWKIIVVGGLLFFVGTWLIGPITGPLIHQGVLADTYQATSTFWRPELNEKPPNMAALMPLWISTGLVNAFLLAGIYAVVRRSFSGAGWLRGLKYGVVLTLFAITFMLAYSGIFNLPYNIWAWWAVETAASMLLGGVLLGWVAEKLAPVASS